MRTACTRPGGTVCDAGLQQAVAQPQAVGRVGDREVEVHDDGAAPTAGTTPMTRRQRERQQRPLAGHRRSRRRAHDQPTTSTISADRQQGWPSTSRPQRHLEQHRSGASGVSWCSPAARASSSARSRCAAPRRGRRARLGRAPPATSSLSSASPSTRATSGRTTSTACSRSSRTRRERRNSTPVSSRRSSPSMR